MGQGFFMLAIRVSVLGLVGWTLFSEEGNRYAQAQRMNIGNCWPACKPIAEDEKVIYTIVKKETPNDR